MLERIEREVVQRLRGTPLDPVLPDAHGRFNAGTAAAVAISAALVVGYLGWRAPGPQNDPSIDRWYHRLKKPRATPPDVVFGLVWPAIEICLAFSAYRLLRKPSDVWRNRSLGVLAVNLTSIPTFSRVFFGQRDLKGAEADVVARFFGAWSFVAAAWNADRQAAYAGLPLALWISFANWLMADILRRNDPSARNLKRVLKDAKPTPDAAAR